MKCLPKTGLKIGWLEINKGNYWWTSVVTSRELCRASCWWCRSPISWQQVCSHLGFRLRRYNSVLSWSDWVIMLSLEYMIILELWNIVGLRERDRDFIMMRLSDYVVSGMHDNLGTLEHCGARCKQCLLLARYLNPHHEGARVASELWTS